MIIPFALMGHESVPELAKILRGSEKYPTVLQAEGSSKARFKRRTFHVPNAIQITSNNPFSPKSDQFQIPPAASPEI